MRGCAGNIVRSLTTPAIPQHCIKCQTVSYLYLHLTLTLNLNPNPNVEYPFYSIQPGSKAGLSQSLQDLHEAVLTTFSSTCMTVPGHLTLHDNSVYMLNKQNYNYQHKTIPRRWQVGQNNFRVYQSR